VAATPPPAAAARATWREWQLIFTLTLIYMLSFVDRGTLNLIVNPLQHDLGIDDLQMSLLLGLSFAALYSVLSVPAGHLADHVSRRLMIAVAVVFWSMTTILCGLAGNYWQLFAGRVGLGVGEAALPPAAYSMLRDGVSVERRGRAFSIYQAGLTLGTGLGAMIGGALYASAEHGTFATWPLLAGLKPWQVVIVVPGFGGILLAFLLLTLREPPRGAPVPASAASFGEMFRHVGRNWRLYGPIFGAVTAISFTGGGWSAWLPAVIGRMWGLSPAVIGHRLGLIGLTVFPISALAIGWLMDVARRRGRSGGPFQVSLIACLLNVAPALGVLLAPSVDTMWISYAGSILFSSGVQIACGIMLANVTPGHLMGKVTAFYYLTANLIGLGVGVTFYAGVARLFFAGPGALRTALLVCYPGGMALTILLLALGIAAARRETRLSSFSQNT